LAISVPESRIFAAYITDSSSFVYILIDFLTLENCLLKDKSDVYLLILMVPNAGNVPMEEYEVTNTTALSPDTGDPVTITTSNGWVMMQRKIDEGSVLFRQNWAEYRDGFGSADSDDNYWLGLQKVYDFQQMGSVSLRVEVDDVFYR